MHPDTDLIITIFVIAIGEATEAVKKEESGRHKTVLMSVCGTVHESHCAWLWPYLDEIGR